MKFYRKSQANKNKFESKILANRDTLKQLLARSRYFLFKTNPNGRKNQTECATILFELYPDIQKAYNLAQDLRNI
jgi:transposase